MPAVIRSQTKYSVIQSFRAWSERILIEAAQEDLYRKYPGTAVRPRRRSTLRRAIRLFFKSGFRLNSAADPSLANAPLVGPKGPGLEPRIAWPAGCVAVRA